ncbi:MAG: acyltransferase [Lachnospiraceae bacterium]|nr:acyltransferase [Lachnospiraceae bacterium]
MIDILVILLAFLCVGKIKISPKMEFNDDYLCMNDCNRIKGLFAIVVVLHHLSQKTSQGVLLQSFENVGYLAVGVFFFISGYGLIHSLTNKKEYLKGFLSKRLSAVIRPYIIIYLVFFLVHSLINGKLLSLENIYIIDKKGDTFVAYSWYVFVIIALYIMFYLLAKLFGNRKVFIVIGSLIFEILWIYICIYQLGYGSWWCNTVLCFSVGMLWKLYEECINRAIRKRYIIVLSITFILFFLVYGMYKSPTVVQFIKDHIIDNNVVIFTMWRSCVSIIFVILVALLGVKIKLGSYFLEKVGHVSYEMYLTQGIFFLVFEQKLPENELVYGILIVGFTVVGAYLLKLFNKSISKIKQ